MGPMSIASDSATGKHNGGFIGKGYGGSEKSHLAAVNINDLLRSGFLVITKLYLKNE
jgi:hypothetical protein